MAPGGERVEVGVGGGVGGLSGAAEESGGRGEQDERVEFQAPGQVVEGEGRVGLGPQDGFEARGILRGEQTVVEDMRPCGRPR